MHIRGYDSLSKNKSFMELGRGSPIFLINGHKQIIVILVLKTILKENFKTCPLPEDAKRMKHASTDQMNIRKMAQILDDHHVQSSTT